MEFGPGMTSIVGPNGCGKSNVSDAVRWVLGEQSAKLLRGSKMEDCIFNGTDNRKPIGMAEVNLTLTGCESALKTEFNEITVTRRVFRSGEGQYFINKTPCRLKDIQRLFMDTGIGTSSYSLMEQGRIDLILSSRPEDRREIFEEASGITKYKTDKREALRKLEQTEANLLRLADIIKEVKRQIISLQRQAGKAARVKKMKQELRGLDLYVSRGRLAAMAAELQQQEAQMASLAETIEAFQKDIGDLEQKGLSLRQSLAASEGDMDAARQATMDLNARLQGIRQAETIDRRRIAELQEMARRESGDHALFAQDNEKQRLALERTRGLLAKAADELAECEQNAREVAARNAAHAEAMEGVRQAIHALNTESMELDDRIARLQNEHHQMETRDRSLVAKRERCAAEQASLSSLLDNHQKRLTGMAEQLQQLSAEVQAAEGRLAARQQDLAASEAGLAELAGRRSANAAELASRQAQIQILEAQLAEAGGFPEGARALSDASNPLGIDRGRILGSLAELVEAEAGFRPAVAAALRAWVESIVVADLPAALDLARRLESSQTGAAQLLAAELPAGAVPPRPPAADGLAETGQPLLDHVTCRAECRPLVERLLAGVRVVESLDALPDGAGTSGNVWVTRDGILVDGAGAVEIGYGSGHPAGSPLARKHALLELQETRAALQAEGERLAARAAEAAAGSAAASQAVRQAREQLDERRRALALQEGEHQVVARETDQFREHLETVSWEFRELEKQGSSVEARSSIGLEMERARARKAEIKTDVTARTTELRGLEQQQKDLQDAMMQANIRLETHKQRRQHLQDQHDPLAERIAEQESRMAAGAARLEGYRREIADRERAVNEALEALPAVEEQIAATNERLEELRRRRAATEADWNAAEDRLNGLRTSLDQRRAQRADINGRCIALRMKQQALTDRIASEHRVAPDAIANEPEPEWPPEGKPDPEALDNTIAELRARIEALGPVFEGAIEEYEQLQERFDFLNRQQDDLVKAKQQLMDMIRRINQTTIDMFSKTPISRRRSNSCSAAAPPS